MKKIATTILFTLTSTVAVFFITLTALYLNLEPQPVEKEQPSTTYTPTITATYSEMFTTYIYETTPPEPVTLIPTVRLGGKGGVAELDRCNGRYIEMVEYQKVRDIQKIYSAHNSCGGAAIIPLNIGDELSVDGIMYKVLSIKNSPKQGTGVAGLAQMGIEGDIILQTCYFRSSQMKFIGIERIQ